MRSAEKSSQAKFEKIEQGMVIRLLRKWFEAARVKFNLHRSGTTAMKEWRTSLQNKEEQADQEWEEKEGTGKGRQMRASAQVKERERARLQKRDPAERIQNVKDMWEDHCKTITGEEAGNEGGSRVCDIFDVCAVSFFRNVLLLARNLPLDVILPLHSTHYLFCIYSGHTLYLHCVVLHCIDIVQELHPNFLDDFSSTRELTFSPLYEAIEQATKLGSRDGRSNDSHVKEKIQEHFNSQQLKRAEDQMKGVVTSSAATKLTYTARPSPTDQQYLELSWWLAKSFVEQAFEVVYYHQPYLLHDFELGLELDQQNAKPSDLKKALKTAWVEDKYDSKVSPMATHINILFGLDEQHFHACNVNNVQQACRVGLAPFAHHTCSICLSHNPHRYIAIYLWFIPGHISCHYIPQHRPIVSWLRSSPTRCSLYGGPISWLSVGTRSECPGLIKAVIRLLLNQRRLATDCQRLPRRRGSSCC